MVLLNILGLTAPETVRITSKLTFQAAVKILNNFGMGRDEQKTPTDQLYKLEVATLTGDVISGLPCFLVTKTTSIHSL
jgi:hypothetical protein